MTPRTKAAAWTATALIAVVIGLLTLSPGIAAAAASNDKLSHFVAFAVLVLPLSLAYPQRVLPVVLLAAVYALGIEIIQPQVGRAGEVADFAADMLGAVTGALAGRAAGLRLMRRGVPG